MTNGIFRFNRVYFSLTFFWFVIEVLIALFVRDSFVRPYLGDVFVVILIYCFVRTFLRFGILPVASGVLLFAFLVEYLQSIAIVERIGWGPSALARTVIGTSFSWEDMLCYVSGFFLILIVERAAIRSAIPGICLRKDRRDDRLPTRDGDGWKQTS